ncbi:MAG: ABC transporter ATP-binding protein [Proteobacteria bacterium]|nr:ABC transporter ATP-binding protein [Pseudomonadota bacterium]
MKKLSYLRKLIHFAYKNNPILAIYPVLSTFSIVAELLAMMTLLPLSVIATSQPFSEKDPIIKILNFMGLTPSPKMLIMTFCLLFLVRIVSNVASQAIALKYGKRVLSQLASQAFSTIVKHCRLEDIEKKSIGNYISLAGDESFRASTIVIEIHQLISISLLGFLYFGLIFWFSPYIALGVFLFLSFSFLLMCSTFKKTHQLGIAQINQSQSASSVFLDALNGLRTVKSLFAEDFVVNSYKSKMKDYTSILFKIDIINILIKFVPIALLFGVFALLMVSDSLAKFSSSGVNFAFVVTMILFLMRFFPVVGQALNVLMRLIADAKAARDVIEMVGYQPKNQYPTKALNESINALSLKTLSFAYQESSPVFSELNYRFVAGKSYAIIGPSGVGKSSLFNVLSFLAEVQQGDILVNNHSFKEYDLNSLRKKIILVEQESVIFNDTVLNNINLGEAHSLERVKHACRLACIDEFIETLPEAYQFTLNYQGQNLSGGQRQRIGLARAILRNPDVILLDEVTSALDEQTKHTVVKNLLEHFKDKIIIFITHDQAVVQLVDTVLCFENKQLSQKKTLDLELNVGMAG